MRAAAVMCSSATARRFARASQGRCAHAARRRESRRAAWRCKLRVGAADCIAGGCKGCIRAAEQRFCNRFQQRAVWTTQWCCTRARGGQGLRGAELHVEILVCQTSLAGRTRTSTFRGPGRGTAMALINARARRDTYGRRGTRGTRLSSQRIDRALLQRNRRSGHTVTSGCLHAVGAAAENDAGSAALVTPS